MKLLSTTLAVCISAVLAEKSEALEDWKRPCPIPPPCPIVDCPEPFPCPVVDCPPYPPYPFPNCPIVDCAFPPVLPVTSLLDFVRENPRINLDYTPSWGRGRPRNYIDNVLFPKVLQDKEYQYRIVNGDQDLGVRSAYPIARDGSQRINFLEWNFGYGISDTDTIQVFAVDPDNGREYNVAQWN